MDIVTNEMRAQLREPLPPEAITKHPTKTYLSSIKSIYVTERLNDVFGIGSWQNAIGVVEVKEGMVVVKVKLTIPKYNIELVQFGGNDNGGAKNPSFDLGDAYKGAVTDAITKIASYLEIGIDVFKGKSGVSQSPQAPQGSTQQFKKVCDTCNQEFTSDKDWATTCYPCWKKSNNK